MTWSEIDLKSAAAILSRQYPTHTGESVPSADAMISLARDRGDRVDTLRSGERPPYDEAMSLLRGQIAPIAEDMLIISMSALFVREVAFLVRSDAVMSFVEEYEREFQRGLYDCMDLIVIWTMRRTALVLHHEGLVVLCSPSGTHDSGHT